eukprot:TRINITY_DN23509_c0_g1_i1.p1 TRINITY_DN23509_c0_g1~~TRINITY_DN23509_c0_g1_i1.p1  ORF type:complete len:179 (-),score=14.18 TRINITY_DN23509_c0_g1_i1:142-678(-)
MCIRDSINAEYMGYPKRIGKRVMMKTMEQRWINNFHLMCSKDNEHMPKYRREFFDTPLLYDVNGSRLQAPFPKYLTHSSSQGRMNLLSGNALSQTSSSKKITALPPISKDGTLRLRQPASATQIPDLRTSRIFSPKVKKMEGGWDSRVYRISMINSSVHRHYRTLFEHIASKKQFQWT